MTIISCAIVCFALTLSCFTSPDENRTWKDSTGKFSVEARLLSIQDGQVVLKTTAGKEIKIPLERLSQEDRLFAEEYLAEVASTTKDAPASSTADSTPAKLKPKSPGKASAAEIASVEKPRHIHGGGLRVSIQSTGIPAYCCGTTNTERPRQSPPSTYHARSGVLHQWE